MLTMFGPAAAAPLFQMGRPDYTNYRSGTSTLPHSAQLKTM